MKKTCSILNNKTILYLLFILTLANLAYFIYSKDSYSILIFGLIAILIYLFTPNMIIVLGLTIFIINILILVRDSREGFEESKDCFDFTNAVYTNMFSTDISGVPKKIEGKIKSFKVNIRDSVKNAMEGTYTDYKFYEDYMKEYNTLNEDSKEWLDDNIVNTKDYKNICKSESNTEKKITKEDSKYNSLESYVGDTIKDTEESDKNLNNIIENVKKNNPEIEDSLKILNGIDMNELNKLINKLNTFTDGFK